MTTTAIAGCVEPEGSVETTSRPTVFVFNTGDGTVSLVDVETDAVVATVPVGFASSFPSNQFTPRLIDEPDDPLWCNVEDGVRALSAGSLSTIGSVATDAGANWQERTPDGTSLVVSAREPAHRQLRIDADPGSETFGEVTGEIDRRPEGGRGDADGPGPCDVTIHPDGAFAYVPDLYGDTLTVIDVDDFAIHRQIAVEAEGDPPAPWMGTAAWDGETLLVENAGGPAGSESIWDVSDPGDPVERVRLTADDGQEEEGGLGADPLTSEIGPDSAFGYVFTPGTEDVTVIDLKAGVVDARLDLGGEAFVGTWDPAREKLYVPIQTTDEVAVIDAGSREIETTIDVGPEPYGATATSLRPADPEEAPGVRRVRRNRPAGGYDVTFCERRCGCCQQS